MTTHNATDEQAAVMHCMAAGGGMTLEDARHITEGHNHRARLDVATQMLARAGQNVSVDLALLRSSGALASPGRNGIVAVQRARRQAGNAKRVWRQLWRFLMAPRPQL